MVCRPFQKHSNLIARPACCFVIGGWGAGEQTVQYADSGARRKGFREERENDSGVKAKRIPG
jgi:hypothetical protein